MAWKATQHRTHFNHYIWKVLREKPISGIGTSANQFQSSNQSTFTEIKLRSKAKGYTWIKTKRAQNLRQDKTFPFNYIFFSNPFVLIINSLIVHIHPTLLQHSPPEDLLSNKPAETDTSTIENPETRSMGSEQEGISSAILSITFQSSFVSAPGLRASVASMGFLQTFFAVYKSGYFLSEFDLRRIRNIPRSAHLFFQDLYLIQAQKS